MSNRFIEGALNTRSISGAQTYGLLAIAQAIENLAAVLQQNRNAPPPTKETRRADDRQTERD